jgi:vesicular inhibitory amino acid transporter
MRHPYKYHRSINITYTFTYTIDIAMAIIGILMFGDDIRDEVTANILLTKGYPIALNVFIVICIAIIPLTKIPLNARPINSTLEIICGLDSRALASNASMVGMSGFNRGLLKFAIRSFTSILFVGIAIVFPSFDRIMTLLGSVCCFSICIILPLAFHLKLFGTELGRLEWWMNWTLIWVSSVMAVVSTVFACLPKQMIGA